MKKILTLLLTVILLQSCSRYTDPIQVEKTQWRLKEISYHGDPYHCCALIWEEVEQPAITYFELATEQDTVGARVGMRIPNRNRR